MLSLTLSVVGSGDGRSHDGHVTGGEEAFLVAGLNDELLGKM